MITYHTHTVAHNHTPPARAVGRWVGCVSAGSMPCPGVHRSATPSVKYCPLWTQCTKQRSTYTPGGPRLGPGHPVGRPDLGRGREFVFDANTRAPSLMHPWSPHLPCGVRSLGLTRGKGDAGLARGTPAPHPQTVLTPWLSCHRD